MKVHEVVSQPGLQGLAGCLADVERSPWQIRTLLTVKT